jgi:hypothetical protein
LRQSNMASCANRMNSTPGIRPMQYRLAAGRQFPMLTDASGGAPQSNRLNVRTPYVRQGAAPCPH